MLKTLGPPIVALLPFLFWGEGSPTKIDYRKKLGSLLLTSLLEDLEKKCPATWFGQSQAVSFPTSVNPPAVSCRMGCGARAAAGTATTSSTAPRAPCRATARRVNWREVL